MAARERKLTEAFTVRCHDTGEELGVKQFVDYIVVTGPSGATRLEGPIELVSDDGHPVLTDGDDYVVVAPDGGRRASRVEG